MNLSEEAMLDLMAYADGELDGEAAARVEAMMSEKPEARQFVEELKTLGECVRVVEADQRVPKTVDFIADDVMKAIARQPRLVVNNDPPVVRWRRAAAAASVSLAIAAAAGWVLFMQSRPAPVAGEVASATAPTAPSAAESAVAANTKVAGVDLDDVDAPHHEVSVFFVPSLADSKASSVVVWIGGATEGKGGGAKGSAP